MNESQLYAVQSALARIIDHLKVGPFLHDSCRVSFASRPSHTDLSLFVFKRGWIGIPFAELLEKAQVNDLSDEQIEVVRLRLATNPKVISEQKARAFRYKVRKRTTTQRLVKFTR